MYFGYFPKIFYNQNFKTKNTAFDLVTDIFYRNKFREIIKNENVAYYLYTIQEYETPEKLAEKYYGDPTDYWIILYANDIIDPFYDWPLNGKNFNEFIKEKYGTIEYAQTTIHHYEKLITTISGGETVTRVYEIDYDDARTNIGTELPHEDFLGLAVDYYPNISGTFRDGSSVEIIESTNSISIFDWEMERNEAKRNIKVIRKDYYPKIKDEMSKFASENRVPSYYREIRGY